MTYDILMKPRTYTDAMKLSSVSEESLIDRIKNPVVDPNKENVPLMVFGKPQFPYIPSQDDPNAARACYDNIMEYTAIQLDFDTGRTIDSFVGDYKDKFKFFLYTSHSHGFKGKCDRFRVIIPLAHPIKMNRLNYGGFRCIMDQMFPDCDPTCFDRGHFQIIPCIRKNGLDKYRYYINNITRLFDIPDAMIEKYDKVVDDKIRAQRLFGEAVCRLREELYGRKYDEEDEEKRIQNKLKWAQSHIDTDCFQGNRDICCYEVIKYLLKNGLIEYAWTLSVPADFQKEWEAKVRRFYK